jgi:hypothetical protein
VAESLAAGGLTAVLGATAGAAAVELGVTGFGLTAGPPVAALGAAARGLGADGVAEGRVEAVAWVVAVPGVVVAGAAG